MELAGSGIEVEDFAFEEGDLVLLYTDGVIEARDESGAFFPLIEQLASCPGDPQTLLQRLCQDLLAHAGGRLSDDAAMVAIKRETTTTAVAPPVAARGGLPVGQDGDEGERQPAPGFDTAPGHEDVDRASDAARRQFPHSRIRSFVPVLVEEVATDPLREKEPAQHDVGPGPTTA
ncbi:PP2C family protein-serine/threonine phosphatase [Kitasatospora sp. NPDC127111]|uniref:PP2C family protein-serine/threonine phosphatase n=1 Tax=Kitasatospora sp. NPDC127111 TaxID=3345363 RepID=UPI00362F6754